MMTRKHYKIVAEAINRVWHMSGRKTQPKAMLDLIGELMGDFYRDNPRFDPMRFLTECNKSKQ
jgi:hypothetical protein